MEPNDMPTASQIERAPKVLLHDHLDGGLRPKTVIELADELGYDGLPTTNEYDLREWFKRGANRHDLTLYLETFAHTVGVMQSVGALERVAAECAEDLAADGVIYAEVRFAPELHTSGGLSLDEVVGAVVSGFEQGSRGRGIRIGTLCTAMRHATQSREIAELAVRWRDRGVVGFDIAGAEDGFPPTLHLNAFEFCQRENFHFTIHAGEAYGPKSIWEAIQYCGAERLGHGVRIRDAITFDGDGRAQLDHLAAYVRDRRIPLEVCPSSNVHTGVSATIAEHPIKLLIDLAFRVTVNTDNRLMSDCSMTSEMTALCDAFGWGLPRMRWLTINAMKSAFIPFDERLELINSAIKSGYEELLSESPNSFAPAAQLGKTNYGD